MSVLQGGGSGATNGSCGCYQWRPMVQQWLVFAAAKPPPPLQGGIKRASALLQACIDSATSVHYRLYYKRTPALLLGLSRWPMLI
jgi:hypothetical protein